MREASSFLSLRSYSDVSIETGKHNPYLRDLYGVTGNSCPISPDTSGTRELALGQRGLPLSSLSCVVSVPWFILDLPMPNQSPHIFFFQKHKAAHPTVALAKIARAPYPFQKQATVISLITFFHSLVRVYSPSLGERKTRSCH